MTQDNQRYMATMEQIVANNKMIKELRRQRRKKIFEIILLLIAFAGFLVGIGALAIIHFCYWDTPLTKKQQFEIYWQPVLILTVSGFILLIVKGKK